MKVSPSAIVSKNLRMRYPDQFEIGEHSVVDDFCYLSTALTIGRFAHVAASCTLAGGADYRISVGDFCSIGSGTRVWCKSDNPVADIGCLIPAGLPEIKKGMLVGDVTLHNHVIIGSNTVIMPNNEIPEGVAIGALSFVPSEFKFEPWGMYIGTPIRLYRKRDRDAVLAQEQELLRATFIKTDHSER